MNLGHTGHGGDHRNGCLAAAGHHVDVQLVQVLLQIDHRYTVRADGRRGEVNQADAGFDRAQKSVVLDMGTGRCGIEHEVDVLEHVHARKAFNAFVGDCNTHARSTGQTVGGRVDANHCAHFQVPGIAQDFNHQVGADIAGADDGDLEFLVHYCCLSCTQVADYSALPCCEKSTPTLPMPSICAS